jgi:hypothetical protein
MHPINRQILVKLGGAPYHIVHVRDVGSILKYYFRRDLRRMSVPPGICGRQISARVPIARFTGTINKQYETHKHPTLASIWGFVLCRASKNTTAAWSHAMGVYTRLTDWSVAYILMQRWCVDGYRRSFALFNSQVDNTVDTSEQGNHHRMCMTTLLFRWEMIHRF